MDSGSSYSPMTSVFRVLSACLFHYVMYNATIHFGGIIGEGPMNSQNVVKNCLVSGYLNPQSTWGRIGGIAAGLDGLQLFNCVLLSPRIDISDKYGGALRRIGVNISNRSSNNYSNEHTEGKWDSPPNETKDGKDCYSKPDLTWWTTTENWKTDGGCSAWDFTNIWEMAPDGYPRLRIVQP